MEIDDPLTRRIHIKMSGCPNGCSQHHIANIGFYGASIKVGEHTIPAYIAHIGGSYEGGDVRFGDAAEEPPAGQARARRGRALGALLRGRAPATARSSTTSPTRVGAAEFEEQVKDLAMPVEFSLENMNYFIDWTKNVPFQVVARRGRVRGLIGPRCRGSAPR